MHRRTSGSGFHAVFAAVAVAVLLIPRPRWGLRVLALVDLQRSLPVFARRTDDDVLWVTCWRP